MVYSFIVKEWFQKGNFQAICNWDFISYFHLFILTRLARLWDKAVVYRFYPPECLPRCFYLFCIVWTPKNVFHQNISTAAFTFPLLYCVYKNTENTEQKLRTILCIFCISPECVLRCFPPLRHDASTNWWRAICPMSYCHRHHHHHHHNHHHPMPYCHIAILPSSSDAILPSPSSSLQCWSCWWWGVICQF